MNEKEYSKKFEDKIISIITSKPRKHAIKCVACGGSGRTMIVSDPGFGKMGDFLGYKNCHSCNGSGKIREISYTRIFKLLYKAFKEHFKE